MHRTPLAVATLALALSPAAASARGPAGTPAPALSPAPCAALALPKPADALNVAGKTSAVMTLSVRLTSCSSSVQSLSIVVSDVAYQPWNGAADCSIPGFTAGPFALRPGESRSFAFATPEPPALVCTHLFGETLVSDAGDVLATAEQRFDTQSRI